MSASRPQESLPKAYKRMLDACIWNPVEFVVKVIGATPDKWAADAMRELVDKRFYAVAGCNGAGKDTLATWVGLWMLATRPYPKGQVTGPSKDQVFSTLWPEFNKWLTNSPLLSKLIEWRPTRIYWKTAPERWFLVARTASKHYSRGSAADAATEGIQGMHEEHLAIILTEASGIDDANWDAAESCCTRKDNFLFAVGNPLRRSGRFYEIFTDPKYAHWGKRHVGYEESSWTDKTQMERWVRSYGAESAWCQVRCFGRFPPAGGADAALAWDLISESMLMVKVVEDDDPSDIQVGVDCARTVDEAVIAIRRGKIMLPLFAQRGISGPALVDKVIELTEAAGGDRDTLIVVDETGMGGAAVIDPLRETHNFNRVAGVSNAWSAQDQNLYRSWDDEMWLRTMRRWLEIGGKLPYDEVLLKQLTTRRVGFTGKTQRQQALEPKSAMARRGLPSPDRAEAVVMACADYLPDLPTIVDSDEDIRRALAASGRYMLPREELTGNIFDDGGTLPW